jgi:hypothetical protein
VPEHRAEREAELRAQRDSDEQAITSYLEGALSRDLFSKHAALASDVAATRVIVQKVESALDIPLADRLTQLMAHQVAHMSAIMRVEIAALEKASSQQLVNLRAKTEAAVQVGKHFAHPARNDVQNESCILRRYTILNCF